MERKRLFCKGMHTHHQHLMAEAPVVICMVTTRPPKTIVKPTALGPVANTDTKLLIYGLFRKGRVLAQDGEPESPTSPPTRPRSGARHGSMTIETARRASLEFVCVFGQDGWLKRCFQEAPHAASDFVGQLIPPTKSSGFSSLLYIIPIPKVGGFHHYYTRRAA